MRNGLLGIETEYGFAAGNAEALVSAAMVKYPFLPAIGGGIFLGNGARLYIDPAEGRHPEYCTPELNNPFDVVSHTAAGEEILYGLTRSLPLSASGRVPLIFKCNVDYTTNATWACHENYGHQAEPDHLPNELIPHLVSRIVYTGAGGLNPLSSGVHYCLSPRVFHLTETSSSSSVAARGIFDLKREPLGSGLHRMHVLCGESLCSHLGATLKLGTTALIVALVDAGQRPGRNVQLRDPLGAIRRFSSDLTLCSTAELADGGSMSALDLQQHYLEFVEQHLNAAELPPWAGSVCAHWRALLTRLRRDPSTVRTTLDWAIKSELFKRRIRQRGFGAAELTALNQVVESRHPRAPREPARATRPATPAAAESPPVASTAAQTPRWGEFLQLRAELAELDILFSKLGPDGLFSKLEHAGVLRHRIEEITPERIRSATTEPPRSGRARLRGLAVRELHGTGKHHCDWAGVVNRDTSEVLDLSNPLQEVMPPWTKRPATQRGPLGPHEMLSRVRDAYGRGAYELAYEQLRDIERTVINPERGGREELHLLMHRVQTRRGFHAEAIAALFEWTACHGNRYTHAVGFVFSHKFHGLTPTREASTWVETGEALLQPGAGADHADPGELRLHQAGILLQTGKWQEARALFLEYLEPGRTSPCSSRTTARARAELAEVHRRLGETAAAERWLAIAEQTQVTHGFMGDYAEFTLTCRAKLAAASDGCAFLDRAAGIQNHLAHHLGLARTLCLRARIGRDATAAPGTREQVLALRERAPSLQTCALFSKITSAWDDWVAGRQPADERDFFWGL